MMNEIVISSKRIKVNIIKPGTVYAGSRFDWTGFTTQVILDNKHTFGAYESLIPGMGTGGIGLCNAFDEIGYDEARMGEWFPKPGIGLLKKVGNEPYAFFKQYEIKPFQVQIESTDNSVTFVTLPMECNGYAFMLKKDLIAKENQLTIKYSFTNTGIKRIATEEFVHNFLCIDNTPIGSDYTLTFPYRPQVDVKRGNIISRDYSLVWEEIPQDTYYCYIDGYDSAQSYYWKLNCNPKQAAMQEKGNFPISGFHLWGEAHVISPEIFVKIIVEPGETMQWERTFEFFASES
jgi:hypothetical protein